MELLGEVFARVQLSTSAGREGAWVGVPESSRAQRTVTGLTLLQLVYLWEHRDRPQRRRVAAHLIGE